MSPAEADLLLAPCAFAALSLLSLLLAHRRPLAAPKRVKSHAARALDALRLFACAALVVVAFTRRPFERSGVEALSIYLYASCLAIIVSLRPVSFRARASSCLTLLLLLTCVVYGYTDIIPLALVAGRPPSYRALTSFALLLVSSVIIPLALPLESNEADDEVAERTSLWSAITFSTVDPIIRYARQHQHVPVEAMQPLAYEDAAEYLVENHMKDIDPTMRKKRRHLGLSLLGVFRRRMTFVFFLMLLEAATTFVGPLGMKQLLGYMETDGINATIQPWVWVVMIGAGPLGIAFASEWYLYHTTHITVQAEALITQLVFEHTIRIRTQNNDSENETTGESLDAAKPRKSTSVLYGKINNLLTSDMKQIDQAKHILRVLQGLLQMGGSMFLLYMLLGWSSLVGTALIVCSLPIPGWIAKTLLDVQKRRMKASDSRVQAVTQYVSVFRMLKVFAWEPRAMAQLAEKREEELAMIRKSSLLGIVMYVVNTILPLINVVVTFAIYTLVMKQELTASRIFASMAIFNILRGNIQFMVWLIPMMIRAMVSLDRLMNFLYDAELLAAAALAGDARQTETLAHDGADFGICAAEFAWTRDTGAFRLSVPGQLLFARGRVNLIVGPTAAGKSSLLYALLGEMRMQPLSVTGASWVRLPRAEGVAFAAQESWVLNETIKENIVFGSPFDPVRYQKVLEQCALVQDLALFEAGDATEVGERGITLSGGQKARVTLARAVYSSAKTVLLDDVLAALDVHTAQAIVDKCLSGDLLQGRTVLLATHNLALTRSLAAKVVRIGDDGVVAEEASVAQAAEHDSVLKSELVAAEAELEKAAADAEAPSEAPTGSGKLIVAEDIAIGAVRMSAVLLYITSLGGVLFWAAWLAFFVGSYALQVFQSYYLGKWSDQYSSHDPSDVPAPVYLAGFILIVVAEAASGSIASVIWMFAGDRSSRVIHRRLMDSLFGATLRWWDTIPTSRVITRCTVDILSVDVDLRQLFSRVVGYTAQLVLQFGAIIFVVGWYAGIPGILVYVAGNFVGRLYITAQHGVKREQSNAKSPVLNLFGAALSGLPSIRAYGAQDRFRQELRSRSNRYSRISRNFYNLNRWAGLRIDSMGAVFAATVAAGVLYNPALSAGKAGFALVQVLNVAWQLLGWVRSSNELEVECNSLERIKDFLEIEQEPKPTPEGIPPAYWPASGALRAENLSARYSRDSADVLRGLSFEIASGERVGVVGRTGAGKSTVALALLRGIVTSGQVWLDGREIHGVNLDRLRASVTVIPQHPELLAGTLRENLDPFGEHEDKELFETLDMAGLGKVQSAEAKIGLDTEVQAGGSNFSVGQRQIIALARAQVRRSKLLIMDEATAAIDYETDAAIQESLRTNLGGDVTVITIAHRLQTIMDYDKIMVLDAGELVEFDSPAALLKKKAGLFYELVEGSRDREVLYQMLKQ